MAYDLKIDLITGLWKSLIGQLRRLQQLSKNLLESNLGLSLSETVQDTLSRMGLVCRG